MNHEDILRKWKGILDHESLPGIKDPWKKTVTALCLENTEKVLREEAQQMNPRAFLTEAGIPANQMAASSSDPTTGAIDIFDPVLVSLVRRAMPKLIAYDICGVQPMTGPTGLIFAKRTRYSTQAGSETFYDEVNTQHTSVTSGANTFGQKHVGTLPGNTSQTSNLASTGLYNTGSAMSTAQAEALGTDSNSAFAEMAFSIEKLTVTAKSRALAAGYTLELAQDLKAIHGLDAETELSQDIQTEILAEINREVLRTINYTAKQGSLNATTAGVFDLDADANGRWLGEKYKGLYMQIELESNAIAKGTRRGKGNILVCSSDVASALQMAGVITYTPEMAQNNGLVVDDTGVTFCGVINGRMRVYIDPYAASGNYFTVGYKGPGFTDAGLFYCPYVPLQMVRSVDPASFAPRIGFKTRYGLIANPYAEGLTAGLGAINKDANVYYRRTIVTNVL